MNLAFFFRKYHKWLALVVGVQALLWCASGVYMTAVHIDIIHGDHLVKVEKTSIIEKKLIKALTQETFAALGVIKNVLLSQSPGGPIYLVQTENQLIRFNANTLQRLPQISESEIQTFADSIYAGDASIQSVTLLDKYPRELGGRKQSIWQVKYDDLLTSTLYFIPETGKLRSKRSDLWRMFDFLWMLHIMDYESREQVNNNLLRIAATVGLLLTLTGIGLLFYRFKKQPAQNFAVNGVVKTVHKWIALLLGLQLLLWMVSGFMFSLLPAKEVNGGYLVNKSLDADWQGNSGDLKMLADQLENVISIKSAKLIGKPIYQIETTGRKYLIDGSTLLPIDLNETLARQIALASYAGSGELVSLIKQSEKTLENRKFGLPLWQANFSDEENSSLYFSAETGDVAGLKTDTWRLFDFFWMLHIMDYSERDDMNNSLVVFSVSIVSFIALSGTWLIFSVFSLKDFNLLARLKRVPLVIRGDQGFSNEVFARKNESLYQALSSAGFNLPSNCGGGGSCGLCRVKVDAEATVSESDKRLLSNDDLVAGYRLACQVNLTQGIVLDLPDQVLQQQIFSCRVISNKFKTPLIKELVLEVPATKNFKFAAGEYVLLHIPAGKTHLEQINIDPDYQQYWHRNKVSQYSSIRRESISRAYSMANPPSDSEQIVLNIRLALPTDGNGESGKASSYLFALEKNDVVKVSGAFGHFHALDSHREMIFIGGGAGMAPLRSHILHQLNTLQNKQKISFWFGARNTQEIFYQAEFDQLAEQFQNFEWHVGLSNLSEKERWNGYVGMIDQIVEHELLTSHQNLQQCEFYICGPSAMNHAVLAMLKRFEVDGSRIKVDDFS